ncbi:3-isopropylmalate dehydratase [bacterium]|nr:3-isopropylmalate dehydratase [candidate division CSSED10-310 bacterium]
MNKQTVFTSRIWLITDSDSRLIDDIDTDMIFHNAHLAITDIGKMGRHAFGNLKGWEHFAQEARPGDVVICGANFGAGSSRQHAVDCFAALGCAGILAESFGAIYKRNAINSGFPILACPDLAAAVETGRLRHLQTVMIDLRTGTVTDPGQGVLLAQATPFSTVQQDIYQAGNLFAFGKQRAS